MFSNRSVSVQPSAPPIEYAGRPDALIVFAGREQVVVGRRGLDAGVLEDVTLYQMVDLLAALKSRP